MHHLCRNAHHEWATTPKQTRRTIMTDRLRRQVRRARRRRAYANGFDMLQDLQLTAVLILGGLYALSALGGF